MRTQDGVTLAEDPRQLGDWTILARLGAGGMGVVYLGERAGQRAAIKTIHHDLARDESFRKRFEREATAVSAADSPRVAKVLEASVDSNPAYIAFKFYDGPNLRDVIRTGGPLDPTALQALAVGLAEGLRAIHDQGVVHRDIKPSNIIMTLRGPVIIDFGIAAYHSAELTQLTVTGEPIGSPTWMSPEYITTGHASEPGDVFGWASTLQFAATAMPPFGIGAPQPLLYRITNVEPTPHRIPGPLGMLVSQALAKNPANRPTLGEILHTLEITGGRAVAAGAHAASPADRPAIGDPPPPRDLPPRYQPPRDLMPSTPVMPPVPPADVWTVNQMKRAVKIAAAFVGAFSAAVLLALFAAGSASPRSAQLAGPLTENLSLAYTVSTAPLPVDVAARPVGVPVPGPTVPPAPDGSHNGHSVVREMRRSPIDISADEPLLTPLVTGPAIVARPDGLVLRPDYLPSSSLIRNLATGTEVVVHDLAFVVDGIPYVPVTVATDGVSGYVDRNGLSFDSPVAP